MANKRKTDEEKRLLPEAVDGLNPIQILLIGQARDYLSGLIEELTGPPSQTMVAVDTLLSNFISSADVSALGLTPEEALSLAQLAPAQIGAIFKSGLALAA
jgi:hypothetical protein